MTIDLEKLKADSRQWLDELASSRGTSVDMEASRLLNETIRERRHREELFRRADDIRVHLPGPPLTTEEIEEAINWGRP